MGDAWEEARGAILQVSAGLGRRPQILPMRASPQSCLSVITACSLPSLRASDLRRQGRNCNILHDLGSHTLLLVQYFIDSTSQSLLNVGGNYRRGKNHWSRWKIVTQTKPCGAPTFHCWVVCYGSPKEIEKGHREGGKPEKLWEDID